MGVSLIYEKNLFSQQSKAKSLRIILQYNSRYNFQFNQKLHLKVKKLFYTLVFGLFTTKCFQIQKQSCRIVIFPVLFEPKDKDS